MRRTPPRSDAAPFALEPLEDRSLFTTITQSGSSIALDGPTIASIGAPITSIVVADFTGGGVPDLAVAAGRQVLIFVGRGDGSFAPPVVAVTLKAAVGLLAVGDFNRDGFPDLVAAQRSQQWQTGAGWLRVLLNDISLLHTFHPTAYTRFVGRPSSVATANLDGDSHRDILITIEPKFTSPPGDSNRSSLDWYEPGAGSIAFRKRLDIAPHSVLFPGKFINFAFMFYESPPVVADLDGDGRDEVIAIARTGQNASRVRLLRFDGSRMAVTSEANISADVTSGAVADLFNEGHSRLVYAAQIDNSYNYNDIPFQSVGTIDILRPLSGPPTLGSVGPPIWMRDADVSDSLRIAAVGDLNGDGLPDIALSGVLLQFDITDEYVDGFFTQVIQGPGRSFAAADTHGVFTEALSQSIPTGLNDVGIPLFTVVDLRRNGRLDLLALDFPDVDRHGFVDLSRPDLVEMPNTAPWKPPLIVSLEPTPASVLANIQFADMVRGASIAHVRCYEDSNNNGLLDGSDELLGSADSMLYSNYPDHPTSAWQITFASPITHHATFFVQAEDSTGALSEPTRFNE